MSAVVTPSVKKVAKKPKVVASHPPFAKMIVEAVKDLKEKKGSSRQAILKHIVAHHKVEEKIASVQVRRGLVTAVKAGLLSQTKGSGASGSFKLAEKTKQVPKKALDKKPKKVVKKKVVKAAKKPASEKKVKGVSSVKKPKTPKKVVAKPKKTSLKPKKPSVKKTPKKSVSKK